MTTFFNGFPIAGQTAHFLVTYADVGDTDALLRAQAVLATCESDLVTLESWFGCTFNSGNATWVHMAHGVQDAGAVNFGYNSNGSSQIIITGTFQSKTTPAPNPVFDDLARMLFVAEFAEILMGYTSYGWQAGNSAGEALSRFAAASLYPLGYYAPGMGPYVNGWLQSNPRPDWVSSTENTDTDGISFGCGILLLYFLVYQLGFSIQQVIAAGASTLAQTFATLTGLPATEAFPRFAGLIKQHLPVGETTNVPTDNIFPLLDPATRHLWFGTSEQMISSATEQGTFSVVLALCGNQPKSYTYQREDVTTQLTIAAHATGYADATFTWSVNGTPLTWPGGTTAVSATVPVTITDTMPYSNEPPVPAMLPILFAVAKGWNTSTLLIRNAGVFPGNATIDITAQASETLVANDPLTGHTETLPFAMRSYDMSSAYWKDLFQCRGRALYEMSHAVAAIADSVTILKNTPDPSPEQLTALASMAIRYTRALREATGGNLGLREGAAVHARQVGASAPARVTSDLPGVAGGLPVLVNTPIADVAAQTRRAPAVGVGVTSGARTTETLRWT